MKIGWITRFFGLMLVILSGAVVSADDDAMAQVRIGHLAPDVSAVDVYIDDVPTTFNGLPFGTVSDWFALPAGAYTVALVPSGATPADAVLSATVELPAESWHSVLAVGLLENDTLTLDIIEEDYTPLDDGETRISFYHAIPEALPVNVVTGDGDVLAFLAFLDTLTDTEGDPVPRHSTVDIPQGPRLLQVVSATDPDSVLVDTAAFNYAAMRHYFFAVIGVSSNPTFVLTSTHMNQLDTEIGGDPRRAAPTAGDGSGFLRVAHLSSGTPDVDIFLNGEATDLTGIAFTDLTAFAELPSGAYEVAVAPAGAGVAEAVISTALTLNDGAHLTIVAHGFLENDTLTLTIAEEDFSELQRGLFRFSVFHALPGGDPVAIIRDDGLSVISFLSYPGLVDGGEFAFAELVVGQYAFSVVDAADSTVTLFEIPNIQYGANRNYFIGIIPGDIGYIFDYVELPSETE